MLQKIPAGGEHGDTDDPEVLDQGIDILKNITSGLVFDGFDVVPVAVHSESDVLEIEGKMYNNQHFDEIIKVKDFYESKLSEERLMQRDKVLKDESKLICSHMDKRSIHYVLQEMQQTVGGQSMSTLC